MGFFFQNKELANLFFFFLFFFCLFFKGRWVSVSCVVICAYALIAIVLRVIWKLGQNSTGKMKSQRGTDPFSLYIISLEWSLGFTCVLDTFVYVISGRVEQGSELERARETIFYGNCLWRRNHSNAWILWSKYSLFSLFANIYMCKYNNVTSFYF